MRERDKFRSWAAYHIPGVESCLLLGAALDKSTLPRQHSYSCHGFHPSPCPKIPWKILKCCHRSPPILYWKLTLGQRMVLKSRRRQNRQLSGWHDLRYNLKPIYHQVLRRATHWIFPESSCSNTSPESGQVRPQYLFTFRQRLPCEMSHLPPRRNQS